MERRCAKWPPPLGDPAATESASSEACRTSQDAASSTRHKSDSNFDKEYNAK